MSETVSQLFCDKGPNPNPCSPRRPPLSPHSSIYTSIDGLISACCTGSGLVNPSFTNNDDGSAVEIMTKDNIQNLVFVKNKDTGEVASIDISCSTEPYANKTYVLTNGMTVSLKVRRELNFPYLANNFLTQICFS